MNGIAPLPATTQKVQKICTLVFSLLILVGIVVCAICDQAMNDTLTWAWIPISSCIFTWLVFIPLLQWGWQGVFHALLSCSLFIAPYLYALYWLTGKSPLFLPIALPVAGISLAYFWLAFTLFRRLGRQKALTWGLCLLFILPVKVFINLVLSITLQEPLLNPWDFFTLLPLLAAGLWLITWRSAGQKHPD